MAKPTTLEKNLKNNLPLIRQAQGLSATGAGSRCKLAHTTIIRIESGEKTNTTLSTLDKLTRGLKVTVEELLRHGPPNGPIAS